MNRRQFGHALAGAALAAPVVRPRALAAADEKSPAVCPDPFNAVLSDDEAYLTDEKLKAAIDTSPPTQNVKFEVVCYNFPSWHPSPYMESALGKGWTEFDLLQNARSLFPGHLCPKVPLRGYLNEALPEVSAREIDLAADSGIDVWMTCWYWHSGKLWYHEQIEQGLLKAPNRARMKFAIVWANHNWTNLYPARSYKEAAMMNPQVHTLQDFEKLTRYAIEHYFSQPNYWRLDGKLVFGIYDSNMVIKALGVDGTKAALSRMRTLVAKAGLGELHLQATQRYDKANVKELGFDSTTRYHMFAGGPPGGRTPYGRKALDCIAEWKRASAELPLPYFPDCAVGWDNSPRFGPRAHVVTQRTPDQFERLMRAAKHFSAASPAKHKIVYLSTWNEWTEDHCLLPDTVYGYGYLDAVRRTFRNAVS